VNDFQTSDRDVSRAIRSWLHEDRHEDVSRVAGAVLDQVEATPQHRATWWPVRRMPMMNKFVTIGLGTAAVAAILLIGANLVGPSGPAPGGEPSASAAPSEAALQAIPPMAGSGPIALEPGRYLILGPSEGWARSEGWPQAVSVTMPSGWTIDTRVRGSGLRGVDTTDEVKLNFWSVDNVVADPCQDPQGFDPRMVRMVDPPVGPTVDDLVSTLTSWPGAETTAPADVTLDGFGGKQFDLTLPTGAADCEGDFVVWFAPDGRGFYLEPGWRHQLWVLDVDGLRFVVNAGIALDASARAESELLQIVKSIDIEP